MTFDGEMNALKAASSEAILKWYKDNNIALMKLNPNRTAVEQPLDCGPCFRTLHSHVRK